MSDHSSKDSYIPDEAYNPEDGEMLAVLKLRENQ